MSELESEVRQIVPAVRFAVSIAPSQPGQLPPEESGAKTSLQQVFQSVRVIARKLHLSTVRISREFQRKSCSFGDNSVEARRRILPLRRIARSAIKLHSDSILYDVVARVLQVHWSPQQMALTLARLCSSGSMNTRVIRDQTAGTITSGSVQRVAYQQRTEVHPHSLKARVLQFTFESTILGAHAPAVYSPLRSSCRSCK